MNEMVKRGYLSNIKSSLGWQVSYGALTGLFGSLLLVVFLTGLMPLGATVKYLPWILAFNASVAGYTVLDRTRDKLRLKKTTGMGIGLLVALLVCTALNLLTAKMTGMGLLGWAEMLFSMAVASLFGGFGAWLSEKYQSIKNR